MQVVSDHHHLIRDIFYGYPGSAYDAWVFQNSPLMQTVQKIPAHFHILAESAYTLNMNVTVPVRDNGHLSEVQKNYEKHSTARSCIEHCFEMLENKLHQLYYLNVLNTEMATTIIMASCVLHNIMISESG